MHSIKFRQAIEEAEKEGQIPQINIEPDITQSVFKAALEFINGGVLKGHFLSLNFRSSRF